MLSTRWRTARRTTTHYWCEALAHTPHDGRTFWLGSHAATTPRLALRWLHSRTHQIADQLDPPNAHAVRQWLHYQPEYERALTLLRLGQPYTYAFHDDGTDYHLTAQVLTRTHTHRTP